ncbi:MAG: biopolymer transporter ExbD [Planctomycetota bacterium]|nr:biopolymer transporter ExbD [Planctomycetota bacterium]
MPTALKPPRDDGEAGFDLTPMIDIVFLLMIFFLCVTELVKSDLEMLMLPSAHSGIEEQPALARRLVVNVGCRFDPETGRFDYRVRARFRDLSDARKLADFLQGWVAAAEAPREALEVKVRADARAEYGKVQQVMAACAKAGIRRIGVGVEPGKN